MQLISAISSILVASAAIGPAGAVPCNQKATSGGATQSPSPANVPAPGYPQRQNAPIAPPVQNKVVEEPSIKSVPEGYEPANGAAKRPGSVSSSTKSKCPPKPTSTATAPMNGSQNSPVERPALTSPKPKCNTKPVPAPQPTVESKKPCPTSSRPEGQNPGTESVPAPKQPGSPEPVPAAPGPVANKGDSPVNPPKIAEAEKPTAPAPVVNAPAPAPVSGEPAGQPKAPSPDASPKKDAAPPAAPKPDLSGKGIEAGGNGKGQEISVTPHDKYSSSIGVLGCKINIDRVAYWPGAIGCDNICVKVTHKGRSLHLLKIDGSTGAHDISYDAWTMLVDGKGAKESKATGGGVPMTWEPAPPSACSDLLSDGKLPLTAFASMNYVGSCSAGTWAGDNYQLYNYADPRCEYGPGDKCSVDLSKGNMPECQGSTAAQTNTVKGPGIKDKAYGTGEEV